MAIMINPTMNTADFKSLGMLATMNINIVTLITELIVGTPKVWGVYERNIFHFSIPFSIIKYYIESSFIDHNFCYNLSYVSIKILTF